MKITTLISILLLTTSLSATDLFKPNYSFKNVSVNYLNWSKDTEQNTAQEDFAYLELEGGAGFDWGEFYMFFDVENPTSSWSDEPAGDLRFAFKPVLDIKLIDNLYLHIQDYSLQSKEFYVSNIATGLAYKIETDFGLWIKPFIASHYQLSTYYSGFNGYLAGWTFLYNFDISKQGFSLSQWHECTLDRRDNENTGRQGALVFLWHPTTAIATGIQYRYASHELGSDKYQDGIIYSLKYNF